MSDTQSVKTLDNVVTSTKGKATLRDDVGSFDDERRLALLDGLSHGLQVYYEDPKFHNKTFSDTPIVGTLVSFLITCCIATFVGMLFATMDTDQRRGMMIDCSTSLPGESKVTPGSPAPYHHQPRYATVWLSINLLVSERPQTLVSLNVSPSLPVPGSILPLPVLSGCNVPRHRPMTSRAFMPN